MPNDTNPYVSQADITSPHIPGESGFGRIFRYSYFTSVAVGVSVSLGWFLVMSMLSSASSGSISTDFLHPWFQFLPTIPSVLTCLVFSVLYCLVVREPKDRKVSTALVFGAVSGLAFNAMTVIFVIEYFYDW